MITFEAYLNEALKSGKSIEDIATAVTSALNEKQKQLDEANKHEKIMHDTSDNLYEMLDTTTYPYEMAGFAALLTLFSRHPDWGKAEADLIIPVITDNIRDVGKMVELQRQGASPMEVLGSAINIDDTKTLNDFLRELDRKVL